ncbi:histidine phosphatase family protein [Shimia sp. R9_1]|uniref:histidine phosphatase family protein n=1 Tax=unclassified Shimia TaxID=2630038 RepID=UPI001ADC8786|nr:MULTISPECIES: histidine phosphatase family protein [unclassified Shimia]MBO9396446.1 histidine phosphatase family protein [Shimia sp. R9_2]MBO9400379.1 histidine phosphatase family protein [Shimia sp. R9_3]MBO9406307.1 histidine phosphatase family protein [Shimia sp. R9_1]
MTELHLVRHGPTHAKSMVGWSDLPADLSDTDALSRLSNHLPEDGLVISSDLQRCVATADAIQGSRTRLPHDPKLREIHFGDWELKNFKEIEAEDAALARAYWENPGDVRPPNGESWNEVCARVNPAIDHLIDTHRGGKLIVVVHFGVILTQVQRAELLTAEEAFAHRIDNLSVTSFKIADTGWATQQINQLL